MKSVIAFLAAASVLTAQNPVTAVNIDVNANRHPISPLIYGVSTTDGAVLADLDAPINRYGGNNSTRYNWHLNADNRAQDWYYESIGESSATPGERGDTIVSLSKNAGAQAMLTVPMIGWVAKLGANRSKLPSFSVSKYGAQTGTDWQWFPDAGNGIHSNGQFVTGNNPNDASTLVDSGFQQQWIYHLTSKWGTASNGGVKYYILDNEHSIWFSTHRDVHPNGPTAAEIRDRVVDYASRIRKADPSALIVGPEEWGWSGYLLSGYDQQYGSVHGWSNLPDRTTALGGMDYLPWLLSQWKAAGTKPIDVFSVHFYPESGEFSNDTSATMQLMRNRSTRSLWDPNYVDQSWISDKVNLIPRLKQWAQSYYYAGTPVAITEYNWGAEAHINGATTQADVFGIFGRENLDIATRWTTPDPSTPTYKAMKIYRNYDGQRHGFGETSVSAVTANPDRLSSFAAVRASDGALTVMVVNKVAGSTPVTINLAGFAGNGAAQAWQLTSSNAITRVSDVAYPGSTLATNVPGQSVTLLVLAPSSSGPTPPVAAATAAPVTGLAPLPVSFDGSASTGRIVSYAWLFGDGATATGVKVSHTYADAGTFTATLTVTDYNHLTAVWSRVITVSAPPPANACAISYQVTNDWGNGFQAAVSITNNTSKPTTGWNLQWTYAGNQHIYDLWNGVALQSGKNVTVKNAPWNPVISAGATLSGIGFNATYSGSNGKPAAFTLNGQKCSVK